MQDSPPREAKKECGQVMLLGEYQGEDPGCLVAVVSQAAGFHILSEYVQSFNSHGISASLGGPCESPHYLCYPLLHLLKTKEANHNRVLVTGMTFQVKNVYLAFLEHISIGNHDHEI